MSSDDVTHALLLELLGTDYLSYLLNLSREDAVLLGTDAPPSLDQPRLDSLNELALFMRAIGATRESPEDFFWHMNLSPLIQGQDSQPFGWTTLRRIASGGTVPELPPDANSVDQLLKKFAINAFPAFLWPSRSSGFMPHRPHLSSLDLSTGRSEFEQAVTSDPELRKLFPSESESTGPIGCALRSTGQGGSFSSGAFDRP